MTELLGGSMAEVLLGFMVASWLFTMGAGIYAGWRYVRAPWLVMRKDVLALYERQKQLDSEIEDLKNDMGLRRIGALTDEQTARIERNLKMRKVLNEMTLE